MMGRAKKTKQVQKMVKSYQKETEEGRKSWVLGHRGGDKQDQKMVKSYQKGQGGGVCGLIAAAIT